MLNVAPTVLRAVSLVESPSNITVANGRYLVRFARNLEEIEAALKLRFEVFNLELNEGLESSFHTQRDRDEFDATCHHLIAIDRTDGNVIGTYRLRTFEMAGTADGFYSASEFDLSTLPNEVLNQSVELGRACIDQKHRNRQVLFQMWKALARYMTQEQKRYLFGCCSLTSQDPREGNQLFRQLVSAGNMHSTFRVCTRTGYECSVGGAYERPGSTVKIPRLFATYLGVGAKVCSMPALDRRFKTIDFLVLFDVQEMNSATRKLFFGFLN